MKFTIASAVLPLFLASQAVAICPGFNFGIGNVVQNVGTLNGNSLNRCKCYTLPLNVNLNDDGLFVFFLTGNVYDDNCNVVDGLTTTGNPCDQGIFGCTAAPITFNRYTSTTSGLMLVKLTVLLCFH